MNIDISQALRGAASGLYPDEAGTDLISGHLPSSGTEKHMLRIAASLVGGHPVNLRDAIPGLDRRNVGLDVTAVQHAAGQRP